MMKTFYDQSHLYGKSPWKLWELAVIYLITGLAVGQRQVHVFAPAALSDSGAADFIYSYTSGMYFQFIIMLLLIALFMWCKRLDLRTLHLHFPPLKKMLLYGALTGVAISLLMLVSALLIAHLLPQVPPQPFEHVLRQGVEQQRAWFLLLGAVLGAPLSEEIFFRGLIYGWLRQYLKPALAYAAGGLIFGLLHFDMVRLLPITLGGMVLCWSYEKSGSLWTSIIAHAIWNGVMIIFFFAGW